jgi:hypothetical protein
LYSNLAAALVNEDQPLEAAEACKEAIKVRKQLYIIQGFMYDPKA